MVNAIGHGFWHEEHEAALGAARVRVQRGGPDAVVCGARNRTGAACLNLPIREGKGRCMNHAGPHAARLHRERQRQAFLSGKISHTEWSKAEARRAANRLGWAWKKNPWVPGTTIDLGPAEHDLRADLLRRGLDVATLAPAVADWLRWRYRRTQIDRQDERGWLRTLVEVLPGRITKAGPRPDAMPADVGADVVAGAEVAYTAEPSNAAQPRTRAPVKVRTWTPDGESSARTSKRLRDDTPRAPKVIRGKGYGRRGRPRTQPPKEEEMDDLMAAYRAHRVTVAPMLERCRSEGEQLAVLRALRDFMADPSDAGARDRWCTYVRTLREG